MREPRVCIDCQQAKPDEDFVRLNRKRNTGLCRSCQAAYMKAYYRQHVEEFRVRSAQHYRKYGKRRGVIRVRPLNLHCPRCQRPDLQVDDFGWLPGGRRYSYCKPCARVKAREWQDKNRGYVCAWGRGYYWRRKQAVFKSKLKRG